MSKQQIEDLVQSAVDEKSSKINAVFFKIIGAMGGLIVLQAGALLWQLAATSQIDKSQQEQIILERQARTELTKTVTEFVKSQNEVNKNYAVDIEKLKLKSGLNEH